MVALAAGFAALLCGCGADCVSICEEAEAEDCPGWDTPDCERDCSELDDLAFEADCESRVDDVLECYAELEDVCDAAEACGEQEEELAECLGDFCMEHPGNRECAGAS